MTGVLLAFSRGKGKGAKSEPFLGLHNKKYSHLETLDQILLRSLQVLNDLVPIVGFWLEYDCLPKVLTFITY